MLTIPRGCMTGVLETLCEPGLMVPKDEPAPGRVVPNVPVPYIGFTRDSAEKFGNGNAPCAATAPLKYEDSVRRKNAPKRRRKAVGGGDACRASHLERRACRRGRLDTVLRECNESHRQAKLRLHARASAGATLVSSQTRENACRRAQSHYLGVRMRGAGVHTRLVDGAEAA